MGLTPAGRRCGAAPARGRSFCLFHDPERTEEAAEARSLGGKRRRRETLVLAAFDLGDLGTAEGIARLVEVVVADALALPASPARGRVLLQAAGLGLRLLEAAEFEERLAALERHRDAAASPTREPRLLPTAPR
jgi:hypothetical protein